MTRTLTFGPCTNPATNLPSKCCQRFVMLYTGFIGGGDAVWRPQQGQRPRAERAKEARIQRALDGISELVSAESDSRKLLKDGGVLSLDQEAFVTLEKYLDAAPFQTGVSAQVDDLLNWVSAAEKVEAP